MADIDELLGLREPAPATPKPAPKRAAKPSATETEDPAPAAASGPSAAEVKAAQQAAIQQATDELAELWREIGQGVTCPGPEDISVSRKAADEESADYVARLWNSRFSEESWRRRLFGCNAPAVAEAHGQGVRVFAETAPHLDPKGAIKTFQREALAMGAGEYDGAVLEGRGPRGGHGVGLWRQVVGADPATAFRAVNHRVFELYADTPTRRDRLFYFAGLGVKKGGRWRFPRITECIPDAGRGPAFVIQLLPGQDAADVEAALPKLRGLLRVDVESVERKPGVVELRLLHRKQANWPAETPLSPRQLWRPRSRAEALYAAREGVLVPVGVTQEGRPLMLDLRRRPHLLLTGTSGAGKSTLLRLQLRALQLQLGPGGILLLADGKGADMIPVYQSGVGQSLSIENASIHRAIAFVHDELDRRKQIYKRLVARGLPENFPLLIICVDELGAWAGQGLAKGASKADAAGVEAAMAKLRYILRQGRSLGIHVLLSTQDVTVESGINTALLSVVSSRIVVGRPEEGSGSAMDKLFSNAERPRVMAAAREIPPGSRGIGVMVDEDGSPTLFKAFHNAGAAAESFDRAVAAVGRARRFAWRFPDDDGAWLLRTCAEFDGMEPVDSIQTIALEDEQGRFIADRARFEEGNPLHDPGTPPANNAHETY